MEESEVMPSGGSREGSGRKPAPDQSKVKKVSFAGQRWTVEQVERWTAYRNAHNLTIKEFEERAFDLLTAQNDAV